MEPRITFITLAVDDLERAVAFYRDGLGLATKGIVGSEFDNGAAAFFNLQSGLRLALWPRRSLAADCGVPLQAPSATEFSLAHNVGSEAEVDALMRQAEGAGATVVKTARPTRDYDGRWGAASGAWTTDMFVDAVYRTVDLARNGGR